MYVNFSAINRISLTYRPADKLPFILQTAWVFKIQKVRGEEDIAGCGRDDGSSCSRASKTIGEMPFLARVCINLFFLSNAADIA